MPPFPAKNQYESRLLYFLLGLRSWRYPNLTVALLHVDFCVVARAAPGGCAKARRLLASAGLWVPVAEENVASSNEGPDPSIAWLAGHLLCTHLF